MPHPLNLQTVQEKRYPGDDVLSEKFNRDEILQVAAIAELAIKRETNLIYESLDIPYADLGNLRVRLAELLDEEEYG